jgi:hypothetical protein
MRRGGRGAVAAQLSRARPMGPLARARAREGGRRRTMPGGARATVMVWRSAAAAAAAAATAAATAAAKTTAATTTAAVAVCVWWSGTAAARGGQGRGGGARTEPPKHLLQLLLRPRLGDVLEVAVRPLGRGLAVVGAQEGAHEHLSACDEHRVHLLDSGRGRLRRLIVHEPEPARLAIRVVSNLRTWRHVRAHVRHRHTPLIHRQRARGSMNEGARGTHARTKSQTHAHTHISATHTISQCRRSAGVSAPCS